MLYDSFVACYADCRARLLALTDAGSSRGRKNLFLIKIFPHSAVKTGFFPIVLSSSLPLAGETTEGEAGCEDFFSSLLERASDTVLLRGTGDH
jgi:hypothetical protein